MLDARHMLVCPEKTCNHRTRWAHWRGTTTVHERGPRVASTATDIASQFLYSKHKRLVWLPFCVREVMDSARVAPFAVAAATHCVSAWRSNCRERSHMHVCSHESLETRGQCECGSTHVSRCCAAQMIEKTICAPGQPLAFALHGPVPPTREGTLRRHQHPEGE